MTDKTPTPVSGIEPSVLLMALAQLRWLAFGECRTEGWDGPPPTASETEKALQAALARFGTRPAAEPCKGTNCTTTDGVNHSQECRDEHDAVVTAAANADRPLFDPNFPSQGYVTDAEWAARKARAAEPSQSGSAGEAAQPFYDLAWQYGATQHTSFAGDELEGLTFTPNDFEAFCAVLSRQAPAAPTQALLGWTRYEKARKLNPAQWAELHQRNLAGETFDDMIDALPATTMTQQEGWTYDKNGSGKWEPVQQDTRPPMRASLAHAMQDRSLAPDEQIAAAVRPLYADDTAASMGLADDIRTVRAVLALREQEASATGAEPARPDVLRIAKEVGLIGWISDDGRYFEFTEDQQPSKRLIEFAKRFATPTTSTTGKESA
jgi:hypothetical protein